MPLKTNSQDLEEPKSKFGFNSSGENFFTVQRVSCLPCSLLQQSQPSSPVLIFDF